MFPCAHFDDFHPPLRSDEAARSQHALGTPLPSRRPRTAVMTPLPQPPSVLLFNRKWNVGTGLGCLCCFNTLRLGCTFPCLKAYGRTSTTISTRFSRLSTHSQSCSQSHVAAQVNGGRIRHHQSFVAPFHVFSNHILPLCSRRGKTKPGIPGEGCGGGGGKVGNAVAAGASTTKTERGPTDAASPLAACAASSSHREVDLVDTAQVSCSSLGGGFLLTRLEKRLSEDTNLRRRRPLAERELEREPLPRESLPVKLPSLECAVDLAEMSARSVNACRG